MSDTVIGTDIATAMSGQQPVGAEIKPLLNDSESSSTELQIGEKFYTIDVAPLDDVRGEFIGHALLVHDVTERKDRELQLQRRNKQLDRFAGVISHDLRNPLHVASGALELARETGDDEHFARVERAHQRMERLIEDLLTLAREGQQIDEQEPVSLAEIARTSWDTVATDGATLAIESDTTIEADPNRFQQLLENLYRNSVEHVGSDVTVRVAPTEDGFLVEDDGSGLPPAVREAVLEASYSAERSGPGIGLMIVRHVADAHDWSLSIENGGTGGAQFRFHTDGDAEPAKKSNGG